MRTKYCTSVYQTEIFYYTRYSASRDIPVIQYSDDERFKLSRITSATIEVDKNWRQVAKWKNFMKVGCMTYTCIKAGIQRLCPVLQIKMHHTHWRHQAVR